MRALDLTGQRFGRLVVERQNSIRSLSGKIRWDCICDCGNKTTVVGGDLTNGKTLSCTCLHKELVSSSNKTHGMTNTSEYRSWCSMIRRCTDIKNNDYEYYGGRGITVCNRWLNSFETFYEDMGPRPSPEHSIDREDVNGNYEPNNCRWATRKEQMNNTRRNVFYEYGNNKYTASQLVELPEAKENGINSKALEARINKLDWPIEKAINTPIRKKVK